MNYKFDVHTHTLVSGHAYSTIREMAISAKEKGLSMLGITEHGPAMAGSCHEIYFSNLKIIDRDSYPIPLLLGVELNIMDADGNIDLPIHLIESMDVTIASLHPPCLAPMSKNDCTQALLKAMEHPFIHIIGHPDDGRYPLDYDILAKTAKETNTLLEVNNSSLLPTSFRPHARENYLEMLEACVKYQTPIILNSDAHIDTDVGNHAMSFALLEELHFPEYLVVNTDIAKLYPYLPYLEQRK